MNIRCLTRRRNVFKSAISFLAAMLLAGCSGCSLITPSVSAVAPLTATNTVVGTFTVIGLNLPLTAEMQIAGGTCQTPTDRTTTGFRVLCTPGVTGSNVVTITTASGGTVIDASKTIAVTAPFAGYSASATGGCVYDNKTGLMWEVKTADGGLRDWNKTYTNYDDPSFEPFRNGWVEVNPTRAQIDAPTNSIGFVNSVNANNLCGHNDWRMPTRGELSSIFVGGVSPTIDSTWFPNTQSSVFWSSSPDASYPPFVWLVYFDDGYEDYGWTRNVSSYVRLVRTGQ
jgi:hypothetical protein